MKTQNEADVLEPTPHARDLDSWARYYHDYYPPNSRRDLEYRLSRILVMAGRIWATHADNVLRAEAGQSRARWQTLFAIDFGEQPVTMTDIGVRLNVQWPTLVRVLEGLEKDGLISRVDNPRDGRSRLVSITEAGRTLLREVRPTLDIERARLLAGLSDEELAQCCETLHLLMERASS
ncbi:MAG TPA: MarR family transcriptional regulator [Sphingobium sp.]|nr:MarR family transcriptional regulator [Sphingobium sp.]